MMEYLDIENWFHLRVSTESGHAKPQAKPCGTEESLPLISRALGQIPVMSQIPTMNLSSGELSQGFLLLLLTVFFNLNGNTVQIGIESPL